MKRSSVDDMFRDAEIYENWTQTYTSEKAMHKDAKSRIRDGWIVESTNVVIPKQNAVIVLLKIVTFGFLALGMSNRRYVVRYSRVRIKPGFVRCYQCGTINRATTKRFPCRSCGTELQR